MTAVLTRMAGILAGIAACFHFYTMVNYITTVPWMGTRKNGVPQPIISGKMENGDYAMSRLVRTVFV